MSYRSYRSYRPSNRTVRSALSASVFRARPAIAFLAAAILCCGISAAQIKPNPGGQKPPPTATVRPGLGALRTDRLAVRGGNDHEAADVGKRVVDTTIDKLLALQRPADMSLTGSPDYDDRRAKPTEMTIWTVEADLVEHEQGPAGEYILTLRGSPAKSIKATIPGPKIVKRASRWFNEIDTARTNVANRLHPDSRARTLRLRVRVTGLGFFGKLTADQKAAGSNGIELQPVINVEWL